MKKILIVLIIVFFSNFVYSADVILFQDNFDDHADWQSPEQDFSSGSDDSDSTGDATTRCASCPPDGAIYSGMYSARASWPDYRGNRTINISSANARGGAGKALTFWMEPVNSSSCDGGTYWCSDGQLSISLSEPVQNITVEYYVKFDANYGWDSTNDAAKQKMIHLTNMNESLGYSRWDFFYPMNHNALTLFTVQDTTYYGDTGFSIRMHPRYQSGYKENIPSEWLISNDYDRQYASGGTGTSGHKTFSELVGDNDWHKVTYTLVGNSALGQADGSYSIAIDDAVIVERTTVEWADTPYWSGCETCINPPKNFIGWNYITIGGNMYNRRDDLSVKEEIYYAVDDLIITTSTETTAAQGVTTINGYGVSKWGG